MLLLLLLPTNVLERVIGELSQSDKVRLGATCSEMLHLVNCQLYYKILIISRYESPDKGCVRLYSNCSTLDVERLPQFVQGLTTHNFNYIDKILIHAQSNLVEYDYAPLYEKILWLWDRLNHKIYFSNYDIQNLRRRESLTTYALQKSTTYVENEEEQCCEHRLSQQVPKVNKLKSWVALGVQELMELPFNPHLVSLNVFIERRMLSPPSSGDTRSLFRNLLQLRSLYLSLPTSTYAFFRLLERGPRLENLHQLSISNSHTLKNSTILTFGGLNRIFNLNGLQALELKVNCVHEFCGSQCIPAIFADWAAYNRITGETPCLKKLAVINFKSCNTKKNIQEFGNLVTTSLFSPNFENLEELYLNIEDYQNLTLSETSTRFDFSKFAAGLNHHNNLKKLIIPDFFNAWISAIPSILKLDCNFFDALVNQCHCSQCHQTRCMFLAMAQSDARNHYTHDFLALAYNYDGDEVYVDTTKDENLKFLNYLVLILQRQFVYLHQNLFSINSILQASDEPFVVDESLVPFNRLFHHSCLDKLMGLVQKYSDVKSVNLGGIPIDLKGC